MRHLLADTLARALFRRFAGVFALAFTIVHLALAMAAFLALKVGSPRLPLGSLLGLTADAWVAAVPLNLVAIVSGAALAVVREATRRRLVLAAALAGRPAWRVFWPLLWFGGGCALLLCPLLACAVPEANYHLRFPVASSDAGLARMLGEVATGGTARAGMHWSGRRKGDDALADVELTSQSGDAATALVANDLHLSTAPTGAMDLQFRGGRLLQQSAGQLRLNASFQLLGVLMDARELVRPSKARLLSLAYYRNDELPRYAQQAEAWRAHGVVVSPVQARRADSIAVVQAMRLAFAMFPLLAVAVIVALLARPLPVPSWVPPAAIGAIVSGLVVQLALDARVAKSADLPGPWVAVLPACTTLAITVICFWFARPRRGRNAR